MPLDSFTCDNCILQIEETSIHLFFRCNFARRCWLLLGFLPPCSTDLLHTLMRIRRRLQVPWRLEAIIIMTWCIWRCRNNWIFNEIPPLVSECKAMFRSEIVLLCHRVKPILKKILHLGCSFRVVTLPPSVPSSFHFFVIFLFIPKLSTFDLIILL
jgi:hypothetical protein